MPALRPPVPRCAWAGNGGRSTDAHAAFSVTVTSDPVGTPVAGSLALLRVLFAAFPDLLVEPEAPALHSGARVG
ncbi:MAG: hypothetical protein NVSMB60_27810 [Mycobacterium sp.]